MDERVGIIGAGSWGTSLAVILARQGKHVVLWTRRESLADEIRTSRLNRVYLDGIHLPEDVHVTSMLPEAIERQDMLVFAVPTQSLRQVAQKAAPYVEAGQVLVSVAKGIENGTLMLTSDVLSDTMPPEVSGRIGVLYGPSHAEEVARCIPAAVVAAAREPSTASVIQQSFMTSRLRVYVNADIIGVQVGGSVKNVMAIAAGISDGVGFGDNTRAAIVTRGISEIRRLGVAMGARPETFSGLSGIGDLVVTCMSKLSRNRYVGEQIGKGRSIDDVQKEMSMVAEGVRTTTSIVELARRHRVEMPISEAVNAILFKGKKPLDAVSELMEREAKQEDWLA